MLDFDVSIKEFLDAAAAKQPTPGGGSITALAGALAASMGEMVINYSLGKKDLQAFAGEMRPALEEFHSARTMLLQLLVEDQRVYQEVSTLRKANDTSDAGKQRFATALLECIRVPQAVAASALSILDTCDKMVNFVNYHLLSDLAVCSDLAMATTRCAIYNVRVNVKEVTDSEERRRIESTTGQILSRAAQVIQRVVPRIWERDKQGA